MEFLDKDGDNIEETAALGTSFSSSVLFENIAGSWQQISPLIPGGASVDSTKLDLDGDGRDEGIVFSNLVA